MSNMSKSGAPARSYVSDSYEPIIQALIILLGLLIQCVKLNEEYKIMSLVIDHFLVIGRET